MNFINLICIFICLSPRIIATSFRVINQRIVTGVQDRCDKLEKTGLRSFYKTMHFLKFLNGYTYNQCTTTFKWNWNITLKYFANNLWIDPSKILIMSCYLKRQKFIYITEIQYKMVSIQNVMREKFIILSQCLTKEFWYTIVYEIVITRKWIFTTFIFQQSSIIIYHVVCKPYMFLI